MRRFFALFLSFAALLYAAPLTITPQTQELLGACECRIDGAQERFAPCTHPRLNLGFDAASTLWIRLSLHNPENVSITRKLVVENPLLETIRLHDEEKLQTLGLFHVKARTLYPAFDLHLKPLETRNYLLEVRNRSTGLQLGLSLQPPEHFERTQQNRLIRITLLIGVLVALLLYALLLLAYTRNISYSYFALYLCAQLFQQGTYVGFLPLIAPLKWVVYDTYLVVAKVSLTVITAALYAQSFLKTASLKSLTLFYRLFIALALVLVPLSGLPYFYHPEIAGLCGLLFVFFNTYAGVYMYRLGNTQARFFIAGWSVLTLGYILLIADALGLSNFMHALPELILLATALEATLLMFAFSDRISELQHALIAKRLLLRELHHRVKNNLQLILSLLRLQSDTLKHPQLQEAFGVFEQRIGAIARTHELLYRNDDTLEIPMSDYLQLLGDTFVRATPRPFTLTLHTDASLPLGEAVYVGLIINELFTNIAKYARFEDEAQISIVLERQGRHVTLDVRDNAKNAPLAHTQASLGMSIIESLCAHQLEGTLEHPQQSYNHVRIRFDL